MLQSILIKPDQKRVDHSEKLKQLRFSDAEESWFIGKPEMEVELRKASPPNWAPTDQIHRMETQAYRRFVMLHLAESGSLFVHPSTFCSRSRLMSVVDPPGKVMNANQPKLLFVPMLRFKLLGIRYCFYHLVKHL